MPELQTSLNSLNSRYTEITDLVANLYKFIDEGDGSTNYIDDGGNDAFDDGNYITTIPFEDIVAQNGGGEGQSSLEYTHTQSTDDAEDAVPYDNPPMDGEVVESTEPDSSDSYFTNMYPGLFVFGVSNPEAIAVYGDFGSDSNSSSDSSDLNQVIDETVMVGDGFTITVDGQLFTVFTRYNIDSSGGDPTIHHLIIAPGNNENWGHATTIGDDNYVDQVNFGVNRPETAFYFMFMSNVDTGGEGEESSPQASNIVEIATKMIEIAFGAIEPVIIRTTYPVYTFEVMAYNLVELFGSCLPENYNQMIEIYNGRTVHIHTITNKMKHGDRFTVEGQQARYLKKMYVDVPANSPMRLLKIVE
jgi:hypothetical protein